MDALSTFRNAIIPAETFREFQELPKPQTAVVRFVDGGSQEILHAGDALFAQVRVAEVEFIGRKRRNQTVKDIQVTITRNAKKTTSTSSYGEEILSNSDSLSSALSEFRQRRETDIALNEFEGITVIDGELIESNTTNKIIAICKTTESEARELRSLTSRTGVWYSGSDKKGYVKFHSRATHIFKVQMSNTTLQDLANLQLYNDPAFLGYPYGLVVADQLARVSNKEADMIRTKANAKLGRIAQDALHVHDAHSKLDTMKF